MNAEEILYKDYKSLLPAYLECQEGWYPLIKEACKTLEKMNIYLSTVDNALDEESEPIRFVQIKEKFGGLRLYRNRYCYEQENEQIIHDSDIILNTLEAMSYHTCEVCGKLGYLRRDLWWIQTLCDEHYQLSNNKRKSE